jgi:ferric-dicitrate binding protein FerR (iron transport regulator)
MKPVKIKKIIVKFLNQEASLTELDILENWLKDYKNQQVFDHYVKVEFLTVFTMNGYNVDKAKKEIHQKIKETKRRKKKVFVNKTVVAACLVLMVGLFYIWFSNRDSLTTDTLDQKVVKQLNTPISPGTSKAVLTLDNGEQVQLKEGKTYKNNYVSSSGNVLKYNNNPKEEKIKYNMLTIPRGGEHFIVLEDGTQVWLNSESQLKYPVSFKDGETRQVELLYGEAYFNVSSSEVNNGGDFKVLHNMQEVEVLGTEFNVKAYSDESNVYTTLVEGKITLNVYDKKQVLTPSQQSNLNTLTNTVTVTEVDVFNEVSWVKGVFSFNGKPLGEIMKVLSRWYDVDLIVADTVVEDEEFNGILSKDQNLEDILTTIKSYGAITEYEINEKEILIK